MSAKERLQPFLDVLDNEDVIVFGKRLSANDTGASGAHQAGVYVPNEIAFALCPRLKNGGYNPDAEFETSVLSYDASRKNRLTWYNQGSRNECRITRWADSRRRDSLLRKDMTGALVVILFKVSAGEIQYAWTWFCSGPDEEDLLEERLGVIEPTTFLFDGQLSGAFSEKRRNKGDPCARLLDLIPPEWRTRFPEGQEIVRLTYDLLANKGRTADERLLARRKCEYQLFLSVEKAHVLPRIKAGFDSVDAFIDLANSVTNRRKSRSGKSFEFHLEQIFHEDALKNTRGGRSEGKKTPDFLFPSVDCYHDAAWPENKLRMLGVKTTCKDRWRQILNEADRVPDKHLVTLQEGVSVEQFQEMVAARVTLVVPFALHEKYPKQIRSELLSLERFIAQTKTECE